jgi:2-polyprenyl-3-methyl-5-hydroxy-6-metoxy-1,4-benzoquinol methylase
MDYINKSANYFSNIRHDLINLIDEKKHNNSKVLEIGAAYGETLFFIKQKGIASYAVGVDIFEDKINKERYKKLDRFIFADIEQTDFPEFENTFDLILLPDVLEHLDDPKKVLAKISRYLKKDGEIIVSMPNIRHYSAFIKIVIKGDFRYEENGIFDYTHVRFYCRKNIKELLQSANYQIIHQEGSIKNYKGKSLAKVINSLTFGVFEEFLSTQYFFKIKKG